jgi:hypothetical protein
VRTYCTLFDRHYLTRAVVLARSLDRVSPPFRLLAFCMDDVTHAALQQLCLPGIQPISLELLEAHDPALASTKADRSRVEYCWTATPAICRYALETDPSVEEVTYLDADLQFFSRPEPLFDELGDGDVLLVPHRYAPEHRHKEATSGTYNVEWLTFRRSEAGLAALQWWHERCIEWCYFRWEDGKLGDQKYLDEFPRLFDGVRVLEHPGGGLAPWNVSAHRLDGRDGDVQVDGRPLVFYHHHSLRLYRRDLASRAAIAAGRLRRGVPPANVPWRTNYPVGGSELELIWRPYLAALGDARLQVDAKAPGAAPPEEQYPLRELLEAGARFTLRRARRASRWVDPGQLDPRKWSRYRDSWRNADVARQMVELTNSQLDDPEEVAPYKAFAELLRVLQAHPDFPRPAKLLDIGSGAGAYGELVDRWAPGAFAYTGADYSAEIVSAAQARWPDRRFEQRDLFSTGALDGFDVVLASAVLDVMADVGPALEALLSSDARWVILHRQRLDPVRTHVELTSGYRGQRTYASYLQEDELAAAADRHGRRIAASVVVDDGIRSFVLERPC